MKAFGGFGLLLFLAGTVYWLSVSSGGGQAEAIPFQVAFGKPGTNGIEMHIVIGMVMANQNRLSKDGKLQRWDEWIATHFELKDANGNVLVMERRNNSNAIQPREVAGTQECFLVATLQPGQPYTLEYTPDLKNPASYRYTLTAPVSAEKVKMIEFPKVK